MYKENIQTSEVEDFDPDFFHPYIFPILADLGYTTTLSINNVLSSGEFAETMDISVPFYQSRDRF